ncbi:MAG: DUF2569 family protein [Candidatus Absconditabacteria bacterium]
MSICPNCFKELQGDEKMCKSCGFDIPVNYGEPDSENLKIDINVSLDNMNNGGSNSKQNNISIDENQELLKPKKISKGLGGRLLVLGFFLVGYLFKVLYILKQVHLKLIIDGTLFDLITLNSVNFVKYYFHSYLFQLILNITLVIVLIMGIYYFLNKARNFIFTFYLFIFINFFGILVDSFLLKLVYGQIPNVLLNSIYYSIISAFSIILVWGSYVYKSKRVKHTFVNDFYIPSAWSIIFSILLIGLVAFIFYEIDYSMIIELFQINSFEKIFFYK